MMPRSALRTGSGRKPCAKHGDSDSAVNLIGTASRTRTLSFCRYNFRFIRSEQYHRPLPLDQRFVICSLLSPGHRQTDFTVISVTAHTFVICTAIVLWELSTERASVRHRLHSSGRARKITDHPYRSHVDVLSLFSAHFFLSCPQLCQRNQTSSFVIVLPVLVDSGWGSRSK
jgi:hypothetical protein